MSINAQKSPKINIFSNRKKVSVKFPLDFPFLTETLKLRKLKIL